MKKFLLVLFLYFFMLNLSHIFAQTAVNIDSLYKLYSAMREYNTYRSIAQNTDSGYIVSIKGDTIFGQLELLRDGINVKVNNDKINKKYRADKFKLFKLGNRNFVSKKLETYPVYTEILDSGKINVYVIEKRKNPLRNDMLTDLAFSNSNSSSTYLIYLEKDNFIYGPYYSNIYELMDSKTVLSECIKDYKELNSRWMSGSFGYNDIRVVVRIYNDWHQKNFR